MSQLHKISGCENAERKADVVFIHGLGGDAFGTWRHGKDKSDSWPHWLGSEFSQVGVWSLGYAASPTKLMRPKGVFSKRQRDAGHSMALPGRALQVLDFMLLCGLGERPLFFICHSLGGLVAKHILRASSDSDDPRRKSVFTNTRAVLFLATPHAGVALASLISRFQFVFGATVTIQELRAHDTYLADLARWYKNQTKVAGIHTASYREDRSFKGVMIVDATTTNAGVGEDPIPLDKDHLSIAKPCNHDEQVCVAAKDILRNHVLTPRPTAAPVTTIANQATELQRLLAGLGNDRQPLILDSNLQVLLVSILEENKRLRDENERLRMSETERLELRFKVEAVQQLLSKRDTR